MPRVFTIFNHGTDFHRDKDPNEVVTQLSDAADGPEAQFVKTGDGPTDWGLAHANPTHIICEGPGSEEIEEDSSSSGQTHAHPGKYNPITNTTKGTSASTLGLTPKGSKKIFWLFGERGHSGFQKSFAGDTAQPWQTSGRVLGTGWDDNVYKVLFLITHLQGIGQTPDVINIVGWSRGAVTCLKMANKIYEVYADTIEINIFAIDPVPGGMTSVTDDLKIIPPNVRNYLAVLALDDNRGNFQPTDRTVLKVQIPRNRATPLPNINFLPLPGNHSDVVAAGKTQKTAPSGILCAHLAWKFLSSHGTRFAITGKTNSWDMPASLVVQTYNIMHRNLETISSEASSGLVSVVGGRRQERDVRANRHAYVRSGHYFINEHHRQCSVLPTIAAYQPTNKTFQSLQLNSTAQLIPPPIADIFQMGITYTRA